MNNKVILESFKVNLSCAMCLGYLTDPLIVKCGHTFCKACLFNWWKKSDTPLSCPNCSEIIECGDFLYNRRLQNLAIIGKRLRPLFLQSVRDLSTCDKHGKDETYFCEEDHRPLCGCCILSMEHKGHKVLLFEKAANQCAEKLHEKWDILNQQKQKVQKELENEETSRAEWDLEGQVLKEVLVLEYKKMHQFILEEEKLQSQRLDKEASLTVEEEDRLSQEILNLSVNLGKQPGEMFKLEGQARRKSVESEFEKKHQLLSDKEQLQLQSLDQDIKDNLTKFEKSKAEMIEQLHNLQMVMSEIEKKFEKLPFEMLQDAKDLLERNDDLLLQNPVAASPRLTLYVIPGMTEMLQTFHRDLTLDPKTAHPHLLLSDDLKSVEYVSVPQDIPDNPERFDSALRVLASQRFTSGKHYWEVEVGNKAEWEVGICRESIRRKGKVPNSFRNTFTLFAVTYKNKFQLCCSYHDVHVSQPLHKVGIFLDYERGHIAFYNAADATVICSRSNDLFGGPFCPYFSPVCQYGNNPSGPLRICPRSKEKVECCE